jgi:coenzyme F420-dependent glucose-6-phosphate dehydrogenase
MTELGYALSSEEHPPLDLVRYARQAEEAGFTFALISDHFHPWLDQQGNSPFVWSVIGGISQATQKLRLGTGVTCPTVRIHPAIIAQAAATSAAMLPGRFFLGVGSGENLNEHILGDHWPPVEIRHDMLTEAVEVIRLLFEGEEASYWGTYYTVENARLYTVPEQLPPVFVAASGPEAAELAGRIGDGLISTAPDKEVVETFDTNSGGGKPHIGQVAVCWAASEKEAMQTAHKWWRSGAIPGQISQELATPALFEQAARLVTEEQVAQEIICGPDANKHLEAIQKMVDAGFEQVYIHQVGPDQEGFFDFYRKEILPEFR